jgi:ribose 5-phosphate isomerase A
MASPGAAGRHAQPPLSDGDPRAEQKRLAARAAAELVQDGMRLGLGTGSTVAYLLPAIAERELGGLVCVATSFATEQAARALGLAVRELDDVGQLDLAIDGADQVDPAGWIVKGGGGAHTREKIVAAAAEQFVVIASSDKEVSQLGPPVPLELLAFGASVVLGELAPAALRAAPPSPDGNLIADYLGEIGDPAALAARLSATPGVVEHGLFAPEMVSLILIGTEEGVRRRTGAGPASQAPSA